MQVIRPPRSEVLLGLMSGTSADGIDVAAVRIRGRGLQMRPAYVDHLARPFPNALRRRLLAVMAPARTNTEDIARLHSELGHAFAEAALAMIQRLGPKNRPVAIGLAGQTVCHLPGSVRAARQTNAERQASSGQQETQHSARSTQHFAHRTITLQLGNPHIVAARTDIPVIADFRQSDVAVGGQGAPLVPWTDWVLFHREGQACAVQNIGGIANVTFIPAGASPEDVVAFDTGPGNMIIDALVHIATGGRQGMDRGGRRARRGRVLAPILDRWMTHPFLRVPPPRTTGRETFGRVFVENELPRLQRLSSNPDDWIATATAFTAAAIADAYRRFLPAGRGGAPEAPLGGKKTSDTSRDRGSPRRRSRPAGDGRRGPEKPEKQAISDRNSHKNPELLTVILCGGGARNPALRGEIAGRLPGARIRTIDAWGIPSEAKEAVSFAILARAALDRVPANLPRATGAGRPARLGLRVDPP